MSCNACLHSRLSQRLALTQGPQQKCQAKASRPAISCAKQTSPAPQPWDRTAKASLSAALAIALALQTSVPFATFAKDNPLQSAQQSAMQSIEQTKAKTRSAAQLAEEEFEKSEFLKGLREKSAENKSKYKKDRENKYCFRQAELGVGDCAGLRLIPGATKSGKQKTPEWLSKILGSPKEDSGPVELPAYLRD